MMQYLIPAAGRGSRFADAGFEKPKPLIELHGIPLIIWVLANFDYQRNDTINIVVQRDSFDTLSLEKYVSDLPVKPNFIYLEEITDGAARTVLHATKFLDLKQPMIVANSDQYVSANLQNYINLASDEEYDGCILTMKASSNKWSYISVNSDDQVTRVVEKQEISNEATVGIYSWRNVEKFIGSFESMVAADDRVNGEFYLAPTYNYMIKEGQKISYLNVGEIDLDVHGLGTPEDFAKFESNPISLEHATKIRYKLNLKFKN
jgi:dTDP-glucose pyrophosphorylase